MTTTNDLTYNPQTWTYIGRRPGKSGLANVWLDHTGTERWFKKLPGSIIGGLYTVKCAGTDNDGVTVQGEPTWTGERTDDDARRAWDLEDRAAYTADQLAKRERKAGNEDLMGDLTLREVREKLSGQFGGARSSTLAQVLRYIGA